MSSKVVCVLGMHRSGTSCLTASLEEAGLFLGDVSRKNPHNIKGNHECQDIVALHEDVLQFNSGSWDNPPKQVLWTDSHKHRRERIISKFAEEDYWGFKDPRTIITLEGWLERLPNLKIVGIFRNPILVAISLNVRNGIHLEEGLRLWSWYNEKLLEYYLQEQFPIISFDMKEKLFIVKLFELCRILEMPLIPGKFTFFDSMLRSNVSIYDQIKVPIEVMELYKRLCDISI